MNSIMMVVNPASANGRTGRRWMNMKKELETGGLNFDYKLTSSGGDATIITAAALEQGYKIIVSIGGDGTLNEVVNGFFHADKPINPDSQLGIISCGTGGDFVRSAGIPTDISEACQLILGGRYRQVDVGRMVYTNHKNYNITRYFINIAGLGMDAETVDRVNHTSKVLGGFVSFLWGTVAALLKYRNRQVSLEVDGKLCYEGQATLIAVANGQYFGGGMRVAPLAQLESGLFNIVVVDGMSKGEMLSTLPSIYRGGHLEHPKVSTLHGKNIRARSTEKVLLEVDGEQPGQLNAEFFILPKAIKLIC